MKLKDVWLFDLDNTLYPPSTNIFGMIDKNMKKFISKKLNISPEEALKLQKEFYKEFGNGSTFPQLIVDGQKTGGCNESISHFKSRGII